MLVSTVATGDLRKMSITKGKTTMHEYEAQVKEIRCQLAEQLRCLETRTETQTSILLELNDYYRRKAEIDMEYGKQLEKLARSAMQRHKNEKNKRECWSMHSICALWQQLVDNTREEARERNEIAELYITQLTTLISQRCDDLHKISRKCREIGSLAHGEVSRVLNELHTAMKTYQLCFAEYSSVESKYRQVEENKLKYEEENPKKRGATRKHRSLTKLFDKRLEKYDIVRVKCLKARNEYLLCVQAANAALHKYFADDLSDLIDCMDLGMEEWLRSLITCTVSSRKTICQKEMDHLADLYSFKQSLDAKADKQRFFEANHATFMLPKRFEFRGQIGDAMSTVSAAEGVAEELQQRQMQIERRLTNVRLESEEIWKSLESTERAVIEKNAELMRSADVNEQRKDSSAQTELVIDHLKNRNDLNELYDYYLNKFSHYLLNSNLIERLEARSNGIGNALSDFTAIATLQKGADESFTHSTITPNRGVTEENDNKMLLSSCNTTICSSSSVTATAAHLQHATKRKKRIGGGIVKNDETKRPRLFGGSLDEYVDATGESIPLIITSTIRVLSQFALHHQGIFRISGSQIEINSFKEAFERGEDPLSNVVDASDVNSVAGVLKLYLRELREPLFPIFLFDQLTECAKCINPEEFIKQVSPLLEKLSQPTLLVLRYLFAFLNHLSEFSDENMMDPYNLAICFGPTLLPIPEGKDQVFYHNFVNELVKNLIVYHENVFSALLPGPSYEKYLLESCDNALYIDDQEAVISGDEEISSTTAMFDSCCIERLPSIGETDYSSVNSNCNNTPTAADALHPSDVHVLSNNTPHINSRTSLSSATAVTATTTTTHVPASTIPITTGITTMPSAPVCLSSSSSCSSPARGCYRTATDHYQPIYHYHFDASSNLHHNHVDNANLNASQQQNLINVSSQKTYGGDGCLSSSGCAEAAMISLDSAFLIRRYGNTWNEQQQPGGCVSNASLTRGQSNAQSVNAEHVFNVPSSQHTSAQIWTRRTGGASSLRQQLHHTRTPTAQHNNDDPPDKDTSFAANRARLHRLSLNAASPPPIGAVAECSQMRERASETNAVNDNGLSAELHHKSSSNCNNNTTLSLRDRLAALSPMTAQLQIELKRRVLGEEIKPSISSPPPPASICSSSSSGTGVGLRSTAVIEEPPPDLVRSLPYDHHHSHSNHHSNSGTATKSIQQRENAKGETEYSYQQKGNNEEMNDRNNVLVVDCKQLVALDYSSSSTPLRMSASDTDASPSFTAHPSSITTNTTTTTPSPGSA